MRERPIGRVYVLEPEDGKEKPYERAELDAAKEFVRRIVGKDVSQELLEAVYKDCDPRKVEPIKLCPFLDSGPYAEAGQESFRDTDDFTVPCVRDFDREKALRAIAVREPIDGFVVPVPRRCAQPQGAGALGLPAGSRSRKGGDTTNAAALTPTVRCPAVKEAATHEQETSAREGHAVFRPPRSADSAAPAPDWRGSSFRSIRWGPTGISGIRRRFPPSRS